VLQPKAPEVRAKRHFTRTELYGAVALGFLLLGLLTLGWLSAP
jgi:hypothetical protein